MRFPWTTIAPSSITSSPRMETIRPPESTTAPEGTSVFSLQPSCTPLAGASGSFSGAPETKAKASFKSRLKSSGPRAQWRVLESPDQLKYSPASFDTRATGKAVPLGPISTAWPVATKGLT